MNRRNINTMIKFSFFHYTIDYKLCLWHVAWPANLKQDINVILTISIEQVLESSLSIHKQQIFTVFSTTTHCKTASSVSNCPNVRKYFRYRCWCKNQQGGHVPQTLSRATQVSQYQKGKTNLNFTEARDSEWQWHQLGRMQVCISLQTDNHASTPQLSFIQTGCPSCRPTNSVKTLKAKALNEYTPVNGSWFWISLHCGC